MAADDARHVPTGANRSDAREADQSPMIDPTRGRSELQPTLAPWHLQPKRCSLCAGRHLSPRHLRDRRLTGNEQDSLVRRSLPSSPQHFAYPLGMGRKAGIRAPMIREPLDSLALTELEERASISSVFLERCRIAAASVAGVRFDTVRLVGGSLADTTLTQPSWLDVRCESCDLSGAVWEKPTFTRVEFRDSKLVGARWNEATFEDVRFVSCQLHLAAFWSARCERVTFEKCALQEVDFHSADLSRVPFDQCDLSGANLAEAKLVGADVKTSNIQGVRLGHSEVRGLIVSREQAVAIAKILGVEVAE